MLKRNAKADEVAYNLSIFVKPTRYSAREIQKTISRYMLGKISQQAELNDVMKNTGSGCLFERVGNYHKIFDVTIQCMVDWYSLFNDQCSPFSHFQGPADRLLLVRKEDQYVLCILGIDSHHYQRYLTENDSENVWLITPNAQIIGGNSSSLDKEDPKLQRLLVQINAFNGNIRYLVDHSEATKKWLHESFFEDKIRMIKLRTNNASQFQLLRSSPVFHAPLKEKIPIQDELPKELEYEQQDVDSGSSLPSQSVPNSSPLPQDEKNESPLSNTDIPVVPQIDKPIKHEAKLVSQDILKPNPESKTLSQKHKFSSKDLALALTYSFLVIFIHLDWGLQELERIVISPQRPLVSKQLLIS